jgi:hypothetical protein
MPSLRQIADDPHDAPIAPDIVPADWADCVPQKPANDAISREKLFAEIRHAAETAAPAVDATFRASDVNDIPARKKKSSTRAWINRAVTAFVFALVSAVAAAAWKHHGDVATETLAGWVPLPGVSSPTASEAPAAEPTAETTVQPTADRQASAAPTAAQAAGSSAALPPEAEQQIQSMARDLAAMGQQVEQLKASIEALKASQQAAVAPAPPVVRPPAPKPPQPKVTALARPAPPPLHPPRPAYPPAMQAAAVPPPPAAAPPQAYPPPPQAYPPPQATTQPNGEPVVRPPMPMPLSDRYSRE